VPVAWLLHLSKILNQRILLTMSTNNCKLNSSKDWKHWNWQFKLMTVAADLWDVIQGLEVFI
jgi:hypothetical protein